MTTENRKEEVSISYLNAVCAIQGISITHNERDEDGIDVFLKKRLIRDNGGKYDAQINVQLKSSSGNYTEYKDHYTYPLKVKNYNDLRVPSTAKSYLFLLVLPQNEYEWIVHSIDELIIKQCMFWLDLSGMPDTGNSSSVTVHLPKAQAVSPAGLEKILREVMDIELEDGV